MNKTYKMGRCKVMVSQDAGLWHLSISTPSVSPSYKEIKEARYKYIPDNVTMAQIFPPSKDFVNLHPYCHHLWQIKDEDLQKANTGPQEEANLEKLPKWCFGLHQTTKILVRINRGESGCLPVKDEDMPVKVIKDPEISFDKFIDRLNEEIGVTHRQRQAMTFGSMFGWHLPMANLDVYDEKGYIIREKL